MRTVILKSKVNFWLKTTSTESWADRAAKVISNAPNQDWKKYGVKQVSEVLAVTVKGYNAAYREIVIGTAKAVAFEWVDRASHEGTRINSFVGFLVAELNGMLESSPIINLEGVMTDESITHSTYSAAAHLKNRVCPACGKTDTIRHGRRIISCRCGYRESAI